jgi:hypothetical protein
LQVLVRTESRRAQIAPNDAFVEITLNEPLPELAQQPFKAANPGDILQTMTTDNQRAGICSTRLNDRFAL